MAISWGSYQSASGSRLRVGIDVDRSPSTIGPNTTNVDLTVRFYVDSDSGDFNDGQTMTFGGAFGGSKSFNNNGGQILVETKTLSNVPISYSSGSRTFSARISGAYNGVTPSHSVNYNLPDRPPGVPDKVGTPSIDAVYTQIVRVTWGAPSGNGSSVSRYDVLVEQPNGANAGRSYSGDRIESFDGLTPGGDYTVRVRAENSAGWGDWSNKRSFTMNPTTPGSVGGREYSSITSSSVVLSWNAPYNGGGTIDLYEILVEFPNGANVQSIDDAASPRTITGLDRGTTYTTRMRARNQAGWGPWNSPLSFTTLPTAPSAPRQSTPEVLSHTEIRQSWLAPTDNGGRAVETYNAEISTSSTFSSLVYPEDGVAGVHYDKVWDGLTPNTTYYMRVRCRNQGTAGISPWSATKIAKTDPAPILDPNAAPQIVSFTATSLTLKGVAGTYTRQFQLSTVSDFSVGVLTYTQSGQSKQILGLIPGVTYYGRYRLDSGSGFGAWSPGTSQTLPRNAVYWNGSRWVDDMSYWDGDDWIPQSADLTVWDGSTWV